MPSKRSNRRKRHSRGPLYTVIFREGRNPMNFTVAMSEEMSQAVVQQYVLQRILEEIQGRGLQLVEQEQQEDRSIRLRVRQWEG